MLGYQSDDQIGGGDIKCKIEGATFYTSEVDLAKLARGIQPGNGQYL